MDLDVVHQRLDRIQWHYCGLYHRGLFEYGGVWNCVHLPPERKKDANLDTQEKLLVWAGILG